MICDEQYPKIEINIIQACIPKSLAPNCACSLLDMPVDISSIFSQQPGDIDICLSAFM